MKRKELLNLPKRQWDKETVYDSIILVPTGKKHDSGFSIISIVGLIKGKPIEQAAFCDDVCWKVPQTDYDFRNDCYYPSGLIHFWSNNFRFKVGCSLSSTDITLITRQK